MTLLVVLSARVVLSGRRGWPTGGRGPARSGRGQRGVRRGRQPLQAGAGPDHHHRVLGPGLPEDRVLLQQSGARRASAREAAMCPRPAKAWGEAGFRRACCALLAAAPRQSTCLRRYNNKCPAVFTTSVQVHFALQASCLT